MIAGEFLKAGAARVYICARKAEACDAAAAELGKLGECVSVPCDVGEEEGVETLARAVEAREERLAILVNNAGTAWGAPVETHPMEQVDRVLRVNVRAVFHLTQRLLPLLRAAASEEDPARVVGTAISVRARAGAYRTGGVLRVAGGLAAIGGAPGAGG